MWVDVQTLELPHGSPVPALARAFATAGGRALVVGGWVRDRVLGREPLDLDLEVHGIDSEAVVGVLESFGRVKRVGQAFSVFRVKGLELQVGLPTAGAAGPPFDLPGALRRRDLTMNSMAWDPLSGELFDPHGGRRDLELQVLRATDPETFGSDPLRALRVAQLSARLAMVPDSALVALCAACDLSAVPGERMLEEFRKLLLLGGRPALGLELLQRADVLRFFPELRAVVGVPQDPRWHPEGDVWSHTLLAVQAASQLRGGGAFEDQALMFGVLCHDLGKSEVTRSLGPAAGQRGVEGVEGEAEERRVVSRGHEAASAELAERFLGRLRAPKALVIAVAALVRRHMAPASFATQGAGPKAYRRLARELAHAGVSLELLERVARADRQGRSADGGLPCAFPEGELFLDRARQHLGGLAPPSQVVQGRHLIACGLRPGPEFGRILARCQQIQDETGWSQANRILDRVLGEHK
jgi:tRNA nucleotidyltransferase (CCA-adding enzyme)